MRVEHHAQRRAQGQSAIGGHAVVGDDPGGVFRPARVMPHNVAPVDRALAHAQNQAAQNHGANAEQGSEMQRRAVQGSRSHEQDTARGAGCHSPQHGDLGAGAVRDAAGPGRLSSVAMYWMR